MQQRHQAEQCLVALDTGPRNRAIPQPLHY
jgi:hypothetical protein